MARASGGPARAFIQRFANIEFPGAEGWHDAEEKSRGERNDERKKQHPAVKTHGENGGQGARGKFQKRAKRGPGKKQSERASSDGKENTFSDHLAGNAPARGAHGSSNGHFPSARSCASKQQVRQDQARDQQRRGNGSEKEQSRRTHGFYQFLLKCNDVGAR